jgi:hypothetical protein
MNSQASKTENNAQLSIPILSRLKYRLLILAFGVLVVVIGLSIQPNSGDSNSEQSKERVSSKLAIKIEPKAEPKLQAPEHNWKDITVKSGDNLSAIFKRAGLNDASMYKVINHNNEAKELTNLFPGEKLGFDIVNNELIALRHVKSPLDTVIIKQTNAGFETRHIVRKPESRIDYRYTALKSNLFLDGSKAAYLKMLLWIWLIFLAELSTLFTTHVKAILLKCYTNSYTWTASTIKTVIF